MDDPTTITGVLITAVGALSGAIGYLYRRIEKRLTDCESDRADLWDRMLHLQREMDERTENNK